jgi:hypothetical protein
VEKQGYPENSKKMHGLPTTVISDTGHCFLFSYNSFIFALVTHCAFHYAIIDCATAVSTNNTKNSVNSLTLFFHPMFHFHNAFLMR